MGRHTGRRRLCRGKEADIQTEDARAGRTGKTYGQEAIAPEGRERHTGRKRSCRENGEDIQAEGDRARRKKLPYRQKAIAPGERG